MKIRKTVANYTLFGVLFGFLFPIGATLLDCTLHFDAITFSNLVQTQINNPIHFVIDSAPIFLGLFAMGIGIKTEKLKHTIQKEKFYALKELNNELEASKQKAEAANIAKSLFLANMSHEVRTPMNGIIGMVEIIERTQLTEDQKEYLKIISMSADNLILIINDILDFSKIESGKLVLEQVSCSIEEIVSSIVNITVKKAKENNVNLATYIDPSLPQNILADSVRLRQIILNLVTNAIKFTKDGNVVLSVELLEENKDNVKIICRVKDDGIGISKENQSKLFKSFSQVDTSTTRKYGGTGLGLAISEKLVLKMDGDIGVESEEGKGATFWFTSVVQKAEDVYISDEKRKQLENTRVLILDDNEINIQVLKKYLDIIHCKTETAESVDQALNLLSEAKKNNEAFDLLITDFQMPEKDGLDLAKSLKASSEHPDLKLILLSSVIDTFTPEELSDLGFSAYLFKPIKFRDLNNIMMEILFGSGVKKKEVVQYSKVVDNSEINLNVLVAEDNLVNQKVAKITLSNLGVQFKIVNNGLEAAEAAKEGAYDVILMDVQMPKMDGIESTKTIRNYEVENKIEDPIYIIAMTANAMKGDKEKTLNAGMNDYISKPFKTAELAEKLRTVKQMKQA